ncbi:MAG: hypothetical protein OXG74_20215 [Acidobacteria bacterium]|nr:hypothetical protein [Acidobacteriota bacterium]
MSKELDIVGSVAIAAMTLLLVSAAAAAQPANAPTQRPGAPPEVDGEEPHGSIEADGRPLGVARIYDRYGDLVQRETGRADGKTLVEHFVYDSTGGEIGRGQQLTEEQFRSYLRRLGLGQSTAAASGAESGVQRTEREFPWGSVTSKITADGEETRVDIFGQRMRVTRVAGNDGAVRMEDDWGGVRTDVHRNLPFYRGNHGVQHGRGIVQVEDGLGTVAEVLIDGEGNPREVRYADNLLVRYHYRVDELEKAPDVVAAMASVRLELIDLRTGEALLDSRLVPNEIRPSFRLGRVGATYVMSSIDEQLFATVDVPEAGIYALLPLEDGDIWRRAVVGGTDIPVFRTEVDYRADLVRVTFAMPGFTVEAPRGSTSEESFRLLFPEGMELPLVNGDNVDAGESQSAVTPKDPGSAVWLSASQEEGSGVYDIGYMEVIQVVGQQWTIRLGTWRTRGRRQPGQRRPWAPGSQASSRIVQTALNEAKTRVDTDMCATLFRAGALPGFWFDPSDILLSARYIVGGEHCTGDVPAYTQAFMSGVQPVIRLCRPFFRMRRFPAGGGITMSRAGVLIHEARHVTGRQHAPNDTSLSVADYNAAIAANCPA